jgi:hypothetical protein
VGNTSGLWQIAKVPTVLLSLMMIGGPGSLVLWTA